MNKPAVSRPRPDHRRSAVLAVLTTFRGVMASVALMSGVINMLMLTGSIFMLQVYDRVLASHSISTLIGLSIIAVLAYAFQGWLEGMRSRILSLVGEQVELDIGPKVHEAVVRMPLVVPRAVTETLQPLRDVDQIRSFLTSPGPMALFDMPWVPIYLVVLGLLHPLLCLVTLLGAAVLIWLTFLTETSGRGPTRSAGEALAQRNALLEAAQRNAEAVRAMGLYPALAQRWASAQSAWAGANRSLQFTVGKYAVMSRAFRFVLQSGMLGLGAYLAIRGEVSPGAIVAGTILSSRALAPIDSAIGAWKGFIAARQSHARLDALLAAFPDKRDILRLPAPVKSLTAENIIVSAPGQQTPIIKRASFQVTAGQALGVIGPSASGKTVLGRALVGIWQPIHGSVLLDGASLTQWDPVDLGPHIGYLPQDVQLFDGTIAENIARFAQDAANSDIIAAAEAAGFHQSIISLPEGYNTRIGQGHTQLSAGQRQRLGLARALYKNPFLVVLDEPNAHLDAEGEAALTEAIRSVRRRGGIAIVIAHRPSAITAVDRLMVINAGEIVAIGPKDEVLNRAVQPPANVIQHPSARS